MLDDEPCVLAIDVGSSSIRAAIVDARGKIVDTARLKRADSRSGKQFDAELLWIQFTSVVRALSGPSRQRVQAVCIAGHVGTVFVDQRLVPVGLGMGWADASGLDQMEQHFGLDSEAILVETGRPHLIGGALATTLRLRHHDRDAFSQVAHVLSPKDFLNARLTGGEVATDYTSAAYTGASNVSGRRWSERAMETTELDSALFPRQLLSSATLAGVCPELAPELGLPVATPVLVGGPDGTVGAFCVLGSRSDIVADISGTTDVLVCVTDDASRVPDRAIVNPYVIERRWTAGGATGMTGGVLSHWAQLFLGQATGDSIIPLLHALDHTPIGADGLTMHPFMSGSRFPRWNPAERGAVYGQSDHHSSRHFLRAAAEAINFVVREGVDLLAGDNRQMPIALAGGLSRSTQLAQLRADVLNRPILLHSEADVTLVGAAALAMLGIGIESVVANDDERFTILQPDPETAQAYEALYREWLAA